MFDFASPPASKSFMLSGALGRFDGPSADSYRMVAGFIGSKIVNKTGEGVLLDIVLGIVGALAGGMVFRFLGMSGATGLNLWSLVVAVVGSVLVLFLYHAVRRADIPWKGSLAATIGAGEKRP
jgi:uncharacterized membrane protein YeaQ/YmgE (transglycosylase-associated protein family)